MMNIVAGADIGVVGLAVMGQNLILNFNDHGYKVIAHNRTTSKIDDFLNNEAAGTLVQGAYTPEELCSKLKRPRRVMLMVKAGSAVDDFINAFLPYLEAGDILIDGGNSHFLDTNRRCMELEKRGLLFVGCGVSGGEEGARYGPSLMPGGSKAAWPFLSEMFQAISAKTSDGLSCCDWIGPGGSGHFVKMVHNGIEYGDMQLIAEAYHVMRDGFKLTHDKMAQVFNDWNNQELDSFLIEITRDILKFRNPLDGNNILLEQIRDVAGQKGTGKWAVNISLDVGTPVTLIGEAVFSRNLSSLKDERVKASQILPSPKTLYTGPIPEILNDLKDALYASKIISYTQGFILFREAAIEYKWTLNYGVIAQMWMGGCIIRSVFLKNIREAYAKDSNLFSLLFNDFFIQAITKCQKGWRRVVSEMALLGIPAPAMASALAFYDGYRSARLPANLIQAQRDYFGAHTFELESSPGKYIHNHWTERK